MKILNEPIHDIFYEFASNSKKHIKLCSPFVKFETINKLYNVKKDDCKVDLITKFNFANFYNKSSDISAMRLIQDRQDKIFNFSNLHAKFYIFDNKTTIISSANLTPSGFCRNYEYGILLTNNELVMNTCNDFNRIATELCNGILNRNTITDLEMLLKSVPKQAAIKLPDIHLEYDEPTDYIVENTLLHINQYLTGWRRIVFTHLDELESSRFTKEDYLKFIPEFIKRYPKNRNVEAKIRQILQQLRDLGLIKFEGEGVYLKLWK